MKRNEMYKYPMTDIGLNTFLIHFWSNFQLQIYKNNYQKTTVPTICFDATEGCCEKNKRNDEVIRGSIFLYEGVVNIKNQTFTLLSIEIDHM